MRDVVDLTERLVSVDTAPGASTAPLVTFLAETLRDLGAQVAVQAGEAKGVHGVPQQNLVARLGGDAPAGLVLAGHLDTVPWKPDFRATTRAERDGRRLYGRGSCDMKGPIAAQLLAVAASSSRLRRPLVLAYTFAEEIGCDGALALVAEKALVGDVSEAACVVGEPTGLAPMVAHKGYWIARLLLHGVPAHSSRPVLGADASRALALLLSELHLLRGQLALDARAPAFDPPETTLNTGLVSAGLARNVIPDRAEVTVELRPVPGTDEQALVARVEECLARAAAAVPGVRGEVEWVERMPAFGQQASADVVGWLAARAARPPGVIPFYTEAELYRAGLGLPTVVCGPGAIDQAHRVDESIAFDELEAGVALYADLIAERCG